MIKKFSLKQKYLTKSPFQTKTIGLNLAKKILKSKKREKKATILCLEGDLGGGKTTFLQGFAKGLGIKEKILSPTFIILKKFKINPPRSHKQQQSLKLKNFYHIDCYRIKDVKEILDLRFKEIISHSFNIVAVEWSDRIVKIVPLYFIKLHFRFVDDKTREIKISS